MAFKLYVCIHFYFCGCYIPLLKSGGKIGNIIIVDMVDFIINGSNNLSNSENYDLQRSSALKIKCHWYVGSCTESYSMVQYPLHDGSGYDNWHRKKSQL